MGYNDVRSENVSHEASAPLAPAKRTYLDLCALNRPLDDQSQIRMRLEADAVSLILSHVRARTICLAVSPVHFAEAAANPNPTKRAHIQLLLDEVGEVVQVDRMQARQRAGELHQLGIGPADAAHAAYAELAGCDFVTVDDRLLRQLRRGKLRVWSGTPMAYCDKENLR
jgi:predicted nucleic acid-binding protein